MTAKNPVTDIALRSPGVRLDDRLSVDDRETLRAVADWPHIQDLDEYLPKGAIR